MTDKKNPDLIRDDYISPVCFLTLVFLILFIACKPVVEKEPRVKAYTFPPEWEPHEAMWIDWTDFALDTRIEMIEALHQNVTVNLLTFSDSMENLAWAMMVRKGIDTSRVNVFVHPIPNYFLRDAGPKYLTNGSDYMLADFGWNCFGGAPFDTLCLRRGEIDNALAEHFDLPLKKAAINMEGGALEVNNTVILAFKEMVEHRNPDIPLDEIEKMLLDTYGKQKMIWIDEKLLLEQPGHKVENFFGQGANGHIDDYMRFVNDSTILVGVMDPSEKDNNPINKIDFDRLQRNLTQIKQATNLDGKPFHIVEIPMPDVTHYAWKGPLPQHRKMANPEIYKNIGAGETIVEVPVMSYLNFTISNGVVLIHRYWQEGIPDSEKKKDAFVYKTMQHFFPNRKIIQINALPLNWNGGGIHCATQQVPQLNSDGLD